MTRLYPQSDTCYVPGRRVHDRTISGIKYLPEEGLVATIAFDNTLRIFNALQSTLRCTVSNDTGGPFVAMEHDASLSQVSECNSWQLACCVTFVTT